MADTVRLRLDLAYDGAPFAGFARQPDQITVQGTLEGALSRLLGQPATTTCAGRTDRGVHAVAQVVHLDVAVDVARAANALGNVDGFRHRLDLLVGPAIAIWAVRQVAADFHARFSASSRSYRYRLVDAATADPIRRNDRWQVGERLSVPPMRHAARLLTGEHDFASFCRRARGGSTTRRLDEVVVSRPAAGRVDVRLTGAAFCHQQVRAILGCLVEVGRGQRDPDWVGQVLAARDRAAATAQVAPPHGLTLERVSYGRRWPAAPPPALR